MEAITWPLHERIQETALSLWQVFGLVGLLYCGALSLLRQGLSSKRWVHLLMAITSGSVGSLWWWISYKPWYFSLLHGTIWGSLVGYGVWRSPPQTQVRDMRRDGRRSLGGGTPW